MRPLSRTRYLTSYNAVNPVRRLLGEQDVEAIIQRLNRLAQQEARMTALQILEVIYGLVENMRVVMDGTQNALVSSPVSY